MAKVIEISAEYGVSVEIEGVWYKLNTGMKIDPETANTKEKRAMIFKQMFDECEKQLETRINEIQG